MDGGERLTYGAWERRAQAAAAGLAAGATVVLVFDSGAWVDYAVAHVAVHVAGGVAVPVPAWLTEVERRRIVGDCEPTVVVEGARGLAELEARGAREEGWASGERATEAAAPADLFYRSVPLGRARRLALGADGEATVPLLHAFPPGTLAGRYALSGCLAGPGSVVVPEFDAERIAALIVAAPERAVALDPATALALAATARGRYSDLELAVVAIRPLRGALRERLREAFPRARFIRLSEDPRAGADDEDVVPAAVAQEGMIWQELFVPGVQNLPGLARRFRGALDVGALGRALEEIVRRHGPLRSGFGVRGGRLVQLVRSPGPIDLTERDLSALDPAESDEELVRMVIEAGRRPFDLAAEALFEPTVVRLAEDDHVLVIRAHHSVFDDWSVGVFRRQLAKLYNAFAAGEPSPLPEPPTTFADFARGESEELAGPAGARQRAFWRRELAGAPLITQLAVGDPGQPPGAPQAGGTTIALTLPAGLSAELRALARAERATLFMTMLAAFGVLVGSETGQPDMVLATVVAGRNSSELEGLIGCFTKKVPFRLSLYGDPSFIDVIARAREHLLGSLANQDLPFEAILQDTLGPAAAAHGLVPAVSVMFQGVTPPHELALHGVESAGLDTAARAGRAHFSAGDGTAPPPVPWGGGLYAGTFVIVSVDESGAELELSARGAFHPPAARGLLERYRALLESAVAEPGRAISELARCADEACGLDVRGVRVQPDRVRAALSELGQVELALERDGDGEPRLVATVMTVGAAPSLGELRRRLWERIPGYALPVRLEGAGDGAGPAEEVVLAALWAGELDLDSVGPDANYWQRFGFLACLARAREAGLVVPTADVTRNRTIGNLATAISVAAARRRGRGVSR